jgi:hypothetical protein
MTTPASRRKSESKYWENRYANGQTGWDRGDVHPALHDWLASGELQPCDIVVPGCGHGHEVVELVRSGFEVTAIDFADSPVNSLRTRLASLKFSAKVYRDDVFQFKPRKHFDAVYEQTCLCAIEPSTRFEYEKQMFDWLEPGGRFFALFMQNANSTTEPPFHCDTDDMKRVFAVDRWDWPTPPLQRYEHPSGKVHEFAAVLTRRGLDGVG